MATKFSGGTYVSQTFTGGTKTNICNSMETQLVAAGWTVVSGTGTTNVLLQSAADPTTGNQGRVRLKDNSGSCVQVTIENVSGSKAQSASTAVGGNLLPATSKTFRILASKYRFECFTPGASAAREFVCAGILWIPAPYQGIVTEAIYMQSNSRADNDSSLFNSFRNSLLSGGGNNAGIVNGSLMSFDNIGSLYCGNVNLRVPTCAYSGGFSGTPSVSYGTQALGKWHDNALDMADPLMGWGANLVNDEPLLRGQVYDWTIIADSFAADTADSWTDGGSSHNWWALTSSNTGGNTSTRGTIWVAVS